MELKGTVAIVTGGASGLGEATARLLSLRGATVVIADLNEEAGASLAKEISGVFQRTDVTKTEDVIACVDAARAAGNLWSLVNCAGVGIAQRTVGRDGEYDSAHDLNAYRKIIEINLVGTFDMCRIAATAMSHNEPDEDGCRGAIVNTASVAAEDGQIGQVAYASSKGGIVGLTLPLARDLSAIGVRANCILPGLIDTPIYGQGEAAEEFKARLGAGVLFPHRLGRSEEFASMAVELLANSYMNAESIRLDAGIRMQPK
jgi:NAD(P)-dependent dehydrogenase (short-subunit alcohol dehydrogenase family)